MVRSRGQTVPKSCQTIFVWVQIFQSMFKEIWHHSDIWTFWFWVLENRERIWSWKRVLKFRIQNFPIGSWFKDWFGDFGKTKWQNFITIFCWSFSVVKLCYLVLTKTLYFSQVFSQIPFYVLNGSLRINYGLRVLLTLRFMTWLMRVY
jgi:hypothetical protein